jgi:hypothetical protein
MERFVVGALLWSIVVAGVAAQAQKFGVIVTAEKGVDFSKFKTYSWTRGQRSPIKSIDERVVAAVDRELGALGMTKATAGDGDVIVGYGSLTRTGVDRTPKADTKEKLSQYAIGTLVVVFTDPASQQRVLRLRTDQPIDTAADKIGPEIDSAVAELFAKYPTRTQK